MRLLVPGFLWCTFWVYMSIDAGIGYGDRVAEGGRNAEVEELVEERMVMLLMLVAEP